MYCRLLGGSKALTAPLIPIGVTEYGCHWRTHIQDKITNTAGVHMYSTRSQNTCAVGVHMCRTGSRSSVEEACTRTVQVQLTHTCLGQGPGVEVAGVLIFTTGSQSTGAPGVLMSRTESRSQGIAGGLKRTTG
jgi:hypothetical protein